MGAANAASAAPEAPPPRRPLAFVWYMLGRGLRGHAGMIVLLNGLSTAIDTAQPFFLGQLVNGLAGAVSPISPAAWFMGLLATWLFGYLASHS